MLRLLMDHYTIDQGHTGGGIHVWLVENTRKPGALRFAYWMDGDTRWRMSGITPKKAALILLEMLKRDLTRGGGYKPFLHRLKVAHREQILPRFQIHRKALHTRIEEDAIKHLSNFGMF